MEARWAVFFDTLRLDWDYEKEGYDLGDLGFYLPDFWVSDLYDRHGHKGMFVEIKGQEATDLEIEKLGRLLEPGRHAAMLQRGMKMPTSFKDDNEFIEVANYEQYGICTDYPMVFMKCYSCGAVKFEFPEYNYCKCEVCGNKADEDHPLIHKAFENALSARFEFGESG